MTNRIIRKEVLILKHSLAATCVAICLLVLPGCGQAADTTITAEANVSAARPVIVDKPILWNETREQLIREYTKKHYGQEQLKIVPQAVVVHWTDSETWEGTYNWFYKETRADGTLWTVLATTKALPDSW